jgi:hypothetical protein
MLRIKVGPCRLFRGVKLQEYSEIYRESRKKKKKKKKRSQNALDGLLVFLHAAPVILQHGQRRVPQLAHRFLDARPHFVKDFPLLRFRFFDVAGIRRWEGKKLSRSRLEEEFPLLVVAESDIVLSLYERLRRSAQRA